NYILLIEYIFIFDTWNYRCLPVLIVFEDLATIMEDGNGIFYNHQVQLSEIETLQKQHEEKTIRIRDLKRQIEALKLHLAKTKMKKNSSRDERREAFNELCEKYHSLRNEYNALLSESSREQRLI
ncbi:hypothetical protein ES288_A08G016400v1, partial [Gossypium darwinii]